MVCPYTGKYLKDEYDGRIGNYATDHIYPQNRVWCGLNVMGNLVLVDKKANSKKGDQSVDDFLLNDTDVLGGLDDATREARLQKIKDFQKAKGYDPEKIKDTISNLMKTRYNQVRENQEKCINDALTLLSAVGISPLTSHSTEKIKGTPATIKIKAMDEFKQYLIEDCGRTQNVANSYKCNRDKIMRELGIETVSELQVRIDEAIDYCTNEMNLAEKTADAKRKKGYIDCRSALRKYKEFMDSKKILP